MGSGAAAPPAIVTSCTSPAPAAFPPANEPQPGPRGELPREGIMEPDHQAAAMPAVRSPAPAARSGGAGAAAPGPAGGTTDPGAPTDGGPGWERLDLNLRCECFPGPAPWTEERASAGAGHLTPGAAPPMRSGSRGGSAAGGAAPSATSAAWAAVRGPGQDSALLSPRRSNSTRAALRPTRPRSGARRMPACFRSRRRPWPPSSPIGWSMPGGSSGPGTTSQNGESVSRSESAERPIGPAADPSQRNR